MKLIVASCSRLLLKSWDKVSDAKNFLLSCLVKPCQMSSERGVMISSSEQDHCLFHKQGNTVPLMLSKKKNQKEEESPKNLIILTKNKIDAMFWRTEKAWWREHSIVSRGISLYWNVLFSSWSWNLIYFTTFACYAPWAQLFYLVPPFAYLYCQFFSKVQCFFKDLEHGWEEATVSLPRRTLWCPAMDLWIYEVAMYRFSPLLIWPSKQSELNGLIVLHQFSAPDAMFHKSKQLCMHRGIFSMLQVIS